MNLGHDDAPAGATTLTSFVKKRSPQVLVVEDAQEIRDVVTFLLRANGYRVLEAEDGLAAQTVLKIEHPALVISDLKMPLCDGWGLLTYCHNRHPEIPVLIVSGTSLGTRPEIESWASGFLPKPFGIEEFRAAVQRLVPQAA